MELRNNKNIRVIRVICCSTKFYGVLGLKQHKYIFLSVLSVCSFFSVFSVVKFLV